MKKGIFQYMSATRRGIKYANYGMWIAFAVIPVCMTAIGCENSKSNHHTLWNQDFPDIDSPAGSDAVSSSTNHSGAVNPDSIHLDPLEGTAYIGLPEINHYGTVDMGYHVKVTEGRSGIGPSISLQYSSASGDGLVGVGWHLSTGLGNISREIRNGELAYDHNDKFTYNGNRLIKVSGPKESEEGAYRMEIESDFSLFELSDSANGGNWKMTRKDGTIVLFGEARESRIYVPDDENKTFRWAFSRMTDLRGNDMVAEYDRSQYDTDNLLYLKNIFYTGNATTGDAPRQYVRFYYRERDSAYVSKVPGFLMRMNRLIDRIEVGYDSDDLWTYKMVYETSEASGRPLLKTIETDMHTTRPKFSYLDGDENGLVWQKIRNPSQQEAQGFSSATKYFEGDFNGDGISDMVFFNPANGDWNALESKPEGGFDYKTYGNRFQGYDSEATIQWFKTNNSGDYNGDNRSDIAFYLPKSREFMVAEHTGTVFDFRNYGRLSIDIDLFKCEWFSGDFDGNGLSDNVLFYEPTGEWIYMRNMGGHFEFHKISQHFKNLFRDDYAPGYNQDCDATFDASDVGLARGKVHFFSGDYNGDMRADIGIYDGRDGAWWVAKNRKSGTVGFRLEWKRYKVLTAPERALFANDRFSGDFNGDGFSDFLLFDREERAWILGKTGDGGIDFTRFGRIPDALGDITRWVQGDFNGDGRTDIGFYSSTDNRFWVGEATLDGFRYRLYATLDNGPSSERIMQTPPPEDDVVIKTGSAIVATEDQTAIVDYRYDGNAQDDRGERVFAGNFTGMRDAATGRLYAELLVYDNKEKQFYFHTSDGLVEPVDAVPKVDLTAPDVLVLNHGRAGHYRSHDGILYYQKEKNASQETVSYFNLVYNSGTTADTFTHETIARFSNGGENGITDFDIDESLYFTDDFNDTPGTDKHLLVLDDLAETPRLILYNGDDAVPFAISDTGDLKSEDFLAARRSGRFAFFSGRFKSREPAAAELLCVDLNESTPVWYIGTLDFEAKNIVFLRLEGNPRFVYQDYHGDYAVKQYPLYSELTYVREQGGAVVFYRLKIDSDGVSEIDFHTVGEVTFRQEYLENGQPVVYRDGAPEAVVYDGKSYTLQPLVDGSNGVLSYEFTREDLTARAYSYIWIQGDYNGDSKTDVGIFNLEDESWYFAMSRGPAPDLLARVDNGIGGSYSMEYERSTRFDNTGDDGIPDLPVNNPVCTKLTVNDGFNHLVSTRYAYSGGYLFSDFIDGEKQSDYFGFSRFEIVDALGGKTINRYDNMAYDDYRKNRALAGAVREQVVVGADLKEYLKKEYRYQVHDICETGRESCSFLVDPIESKTFRRDFTSGNFVLTETRTSKTALAAGRYALLSRTTTTTDHYSDAVHAQVTNTTYHEYENVDVTNETRLKKTVELQGSDEETTRTYRYDERGLMTGERLYYTGSGLAAATDIVMAYAYDGYGNRVRTTDASGSPGRVEETVYDSALHQYPVETRVLKDDGYLSTKIAINYDRAFGKPSRIEGPDGNRVYLYYDDAARLERKAADTESGVKNLERYEYDSEFPLSAKVTKYTGTDDPDIESRRYIDGLSRLLHTVSRVGKERGRRYVKSGKIVYDALGRVVKTCQPDWADDREIDDYVLHDTEKNPTVTAYDGSGRILKTVLPAAYHGEPETGIAYTYNDPWETIVTAPGGITTRRVVNARGLLLYVEESGAGDDGTIVTSKIGFAYDASGRRTRKMELDDDAVMDLSAPAALFTEGARDTSGRHISAWRYDGLGRVVETSDPDFGYSTVEYNAFGQAIRRRDARGLEQRLVYDGMGRLIEKQLPDGEGRVRYTYDSLSGSVNSMGRLVAIDDPAATKQFGYDKMGRLVEERRSIKNALEERDYVTKSQYDLLGRTVWLQYPSGIDGEDPLEVRYTYQPAGNDTISVGTAAGQKDIIAGAVFDAFGQLDALVRGNGTTTRYTYDTKRRLKNLTTTSGSGANQQVLQDVTYEFDIDNTIRSLKSTSTVEPLDDGASLVRYDYRYDGLNRLINARGAHEDLSTSKTMHRFERRYGYSPNGNLLTKETIDTSDGSVEDRWRYRYTNHAVTNISTTKDGDRFSFAYDAVGNLVSKEDTAQGKVTLMRYDSHNRMVDATDGDNDILGEYGYDSDGFRVRKLTRRYDPVSDGPDIELIYPSMYIGIERELDSDGNPVEWREYVVNHIYRDGVRVAAVIPDGRAQYYLTDQVDSVKLVVDDQGNPVTRIEHLPYGETWFTQGNTTNRPKFNSQELDVETGLYYFNARYYDPEIARFVTADPIIDDENTAMGWNGYMYVKGNPITYKDPTGKNGESNLPWYYQKKVPIADSFIYPFDKYKKAKEYFESEVNNVYPKNPTANPSRFKNVNYESGPVNRQDVGSYYEGKAESFGGGIHPGEDWYAHQLYAVANGRVVYLNPTSRRGPQSLGYTLILEHTLEDGSTVYSTYVHVTSPNKSNAEITADVKDFPYQVGDIVKKGDLIARVGKSSGAPYHLHFEMRDGSKMKITQNTDIYPNDNGLGYYTSKPGERLHQGISKAEAVKAFGLMKKDGIIDPSDFIDNHHKAEPRYDLSCPYYPVVR